MAFLDDLWPTILKASQMTGVDPRIIGAQAALESGYGKHAPGNNLFGIKSHGQAGGNTLATTEVVNGQPVRVQDSFRGYASPQDSILGYAEFINKNPRYGPFRSAQGMDAQIDALGKSGYATDPNYAAKIRSIATAIQPPTLGPSPSSPAGGARAASEIQPFGSMAPSPSPAGTAIANWFNGTQKDADAINAVQNGDKPSPLQRLASALKDFPNAPQARSDMPGPAATNGDALLKYMQNPRQLAEFFLKQRLGQG